MLLVFYRPEDVGCLPDGAKPSSLARELEDAETRGEEKQSLISDDDTDEATDSGGGSQYENPAVAKKQRDYTLHEALRTSQFYLLNADTLVGWMFGAGISL